MEAAIAMCRFPTTVMLNVGTSTAKYFIFNSIIGELCQHVFSLAGHWKLGKEVVEHRKYLQGTENSCDCAAVDINATPVPVNLDAMAQ